MNDKDTVVDAYAARRDAVMRGLASFCESTPDFDMSARMRRSAAEHILGMVDLAAAPSTSVREEGRRWVVAEARKSLRLVEGCLECNADDERRWRETIEWLEALA